MTDISKTILERYQVRKTKKQKQAFRAVVGEFCESLGYPMTVEKGAFGVRNVVIGNPECAKVVYTAHYDTCAVLPFPNFITPRRFDLYLLYQVALVVALLVPIGLIGFGLGYLSGWLLGAVSALIDNPLVAEVGSSVVSAGFYVLFLLVLFAGPANKHTANDNTSGVTLMVEIMAALPADKRNEVAFVLFDLEEAGMLGSSAFASKHKTVKRHIPLINFDCVSDGDRVLIAPRRHARDLCEVLASAFASDETVTATVVPSGVFYPSDQTNFRRGVGVAALKQSKGGILYMNRIHTKHDTVYREENIAFLTAGAVKLVTML